MSLHHTLWVAAGGAVGAVGRYAMVSFVGAMFGAGFPYGTLAVNVIGSFVLGVFVEVSALVWSPSPEFRAMFVIGVLGAFTTFSTFSLDAVTLFTRGETGAALLYVGLSVVVCLGAVWAGLALTRMILA